MMSCVRPSILQIAAALLAAAIVPARGGAAGSLAAQEPAGRSAAGAIAAVVWQPFGFDDAYSWMTGAGAFYELRAPVLGVPLVLGARVAACAQQPLLAGFDRSFTILAGPYGGWELLRRAGSDLGFSLVPYVGCLQYWRWQRSDGQEYLSSRPMLVVGIAFDLFLGRRVMCGVAAEPMLIVDRTPLFSLAQIQRAGVRF